MNKKKLLEDIYRKIDGELPEPELQELDQHLRNDPEAMRLYQQCLKIGHQFNHLKTNQTEPELTSDIMREVRASQHKKQTSSPSFGLAQDFWLQPLFKYSYMFAGGFLVGFLIFSFFKSDFTLSSKNTDGMKGTMLQSAPFDELKVADLLLFDDPRVKAVCNVRYSNEIVEIHLDISSGEATKTFLEFDPSHFRILNFQAVQVNEVSNALTGGNSIMINNTGDNKYIIQLLNKSTLSHPILIRILQEDQQLFQNSVKIN
jgi:hypothetical protein